MSSLDDYRDNPVLLYDGVCGFCNKTVQFILRHDRRGDMRFAALQSNYGEGVLAHYPALQRLDSLIVVHKVNGEERVLTRLEAARSRFLENHGRQLSAGE